MSKQNTWQELIKPKKPVFKAGVDEDSRKTATVVVEPLEHGFGLALGYALKQVLLSSLKGAAITAVRIDGVSPDYSTISGVHENFTEVISNIQEIELRMETERLNCMVIHKFGPGSVVAGDIQTRKNIEILNPDHIICTLDRGAEIHMELIAEIGKGFEPVEHNRPYDSPNGLIPVDSLFSPVKKVSYKVEDTCKGRMSDYDKLTLTVETDGSISPEDAFMYSTRLLQDHLTVLVNSQKPQMVHAGESSSEIEFIPVLLKNVNELELSSLTSKCLIGENVVYVGDLIQWTEPEMLRIPNFGRKSLNEIKNALAQMRLHLGMEVETWSSENVDFNPELLKKVDELALSVRSYGCFRNEGIVFIGDFIQKSEDEMLRISNFGRKSLKELKEALDQLGLHLGMKVDSWPPENIDDLAKRYKVKYILR